MLQILKVSQLNRYVRSQLEADPRLQEVYVAGEIGTLSAYQRSGHIYFTLRDGDSSVRAVMFSSNAQFLRFAPQQGMRVIVRGSVTLYERDGAFQIIASEIMLDGAGAQGFAFERQKQLLEKKGYFAEEHKRPIPAMPQTIGVVTSTSGAALHDIIVTLSNQNPTVKLIVAHASVQGAAAAEEIAAAIRLINRDSRCDVLIVGRGGGSAEDLWCFNEEAVVKAVFESKIPVISAVGHETDITLCDLAADIRAATPTAAAQKAVCPVTRLCDMLYGRSIALDSAMANRINRCQQTLDKIKSAPQLQNPSDLVDKNRQTLNNLVSSMYNVMELRISRCVDSLNEKAALLESLSPLRVLSRGYSIAMKGGKAVTDSALLDLNDEITLKFSHGEAKAVIIALEKENRHDI